MYLFTITFVLVFTLVITLNYHSLLITSIYLLATSNSILISIHTYLIILNTKDYPSLTALTCILLTYHYLSRYLPKDCYAIMVSHLLGVSTMFTIYHYTTELMYPNTLALSSKRQWFFFSNIH